MEDRHSKEMMRNQTIAVILMALLFVVWFKFFVPPPPAPKAPVAQPAQTQQPTDQPQLEQPVPAPTSLSVWPELPPVPEIQDPAAEEVRLTGDKLDLVFTRIGARLKQVSVLSDTGVLGQQLVPSSVAPDTETVYPLGLTFTEEGLRDHLNRLRWDIIDQQPNSITFQLAIPNRAAIVKRFTVESGTHLVQVEVSYNNLSNQTVSLGLDQTPAYYLGWGPNVTSGDEKMAVKQSIVWRKDGKNEEVVTSKMSGDDGPYAMTTPNAEWIGVKSTYFIVALHPEFEAAQALAEGLPGNFQIAAAAPRTAIEPGQTNTAKFTLYAGPNEQRALHQAWDSLASASRFFDNNLMNGFAKFLLAILNWFYTYLIANYGLAIIFLTAVVRLAMFPLTLKSMKSMKKMQLLGPELEQLKEKYGDNQQELNKAMMEMYRERGVNPVGGCFPMLLQMPVFIALYRMLWNAYELRGAHFWLWINDLSQPDQLFHIPALAQIPLIGTFEYINVLPFLMGIAMVVSQKVTPASGPATNPQQKLMMNIMPVFFSFICYNMASGLNLYILTSTVLGMVQQKFVHVGETELQKKKAPAKRQHFYTAAMARKRQMAKDSKKEVRKDSQRKPK